MRNGKVKRYAHVLDIPEGVSGSVRVTHKHYPAGQKLQTGNIRTALFGQKIQNLRFDQPTRWHELSEEGQGVWMTDLPIEQRQCDELIRHATGHVLVGGLGLGYAVVALAARKRVKAITVVEKSEDVIALTWEATKAAVEKIRPGLSLSIVHEDLFTYLGAGREAPGIEWPLYTWALFDIWQMDGETCFHDVVVPLRRLADGIVRKVECWNEDVMRGQLFQGLMTRRLMLESGDPEFAAMVSLDMLCDAKIPSQYLAWAVPFWEWYREYGRAATMDKSLVNFVMARYAKEYGRPECNDGRNVLWHARPQVAAALRAASV